MKHSKKPGVVRDKIAELIGDLPRLEMFARESANGWDVFGNEAPNSIEIPSKSFEKEIKRLRAEIERIENDENNEGQATYLVEIDRLTGMIKNYLNNIDELNKISRRN